jgi:hypothetical protein
MRYRWSALALVLTLVLMPRVGSAQSSGTTQKAPGRTLKQNYPNPFNPETRGPFEILGEPACPEGGKLHRVTLKIYNILMQEVAVPVLQGGTGSVAGGQPLDRVSLPCGQYTWYWNGNYRRTGQEAASGVYILVVDVDGHKESLKMSVKK